MTAIATKRRSPKELLPVLLPFLSFSGFRKEYLTMAPQSSSLNENALCAIEYFTKDLNPVLERIMHQDPELDHQPFGFPREVSFCSKKDALVGSRE